MWTAISPILGGSQGSVSTIAVAPSDPQTVWAGTSPVGGAAIWIHPRNPAEVASAAVAQSVQAGWDMMTSVNLAVPGVKMVTLKQGALRRGVSIVSGHVMLNDAMETRDGSRSSS